MFIEVSRDGNILGQFSDTMVTHKLASGEFRSDDQYRVPGAMRWLSLSNHPLVGHASRTAAADVWKQARPPSGTPFTVVVDPACAIGFAGSISLFLGVFAPAVKVPLLGSVNHIQQGSGAGIALLVIAAVSALLVIARLFRWLWATGSAALLAILASFIALKHEVSTVKQRDFATKGDIFDGLESAFADAVQLDWGFAVLLIGSATLLVAAAIGTGKLRLSR